MSEEKDVLKLEYTDWTGKITSSITIDLKNYAGEDDYIRSRVQQFLTFIGLDEVE